MDPVILALLGTVFSVLTVLAATVALNFKKCPPISSIIVHNKFGGEPRIITDDFGTVIIPKIETMQIISHEVMVLLVETRTPIISADAVPLRIKAIAQIKVAKDHGSIKKAAKQLKDMSDREIVEMAQEKILNTMRYEIQSHRALEIIENSTELCHQIMRDSSTTLGQYGLKVSNFEISELKDTIGFIESLGFAKSVKTVETLRLQHQSSELHRV